jgi:hypothetical protein
MGLAVGLLIIMLLMALGVLAFIIAGIVFVIVGIKRDDDIYLDVL